MKKNFVEIPNPASLQKLKEAEETWTWYVAHKDTKVGTQTKYVKLGRESTCFWLDWVKEDSGWHTFIRKNEIVEAEVCKPLWDAIRAGALIEVNEKGEEIQVHRFNGQNL